MPLDSRVDQGDPVVTFNMRRISCVFGTSGWNTDISEPTLPPNQANDQRPQVPLQCVALSLAVM